MTIPTIENTVQDTDTGVTSLTLSAFTVTNANAILVGVRMNGAYSSLSIARDGQSFILVDTQTFNVSVDLLVYKLRSPNSGTSDIVLSWTTADTARALSVGVVDGGSIETQAKALDDSGTDDTPTVAVTTEVDDLVIDFASSSTSVAYTDDEGQQIGTTVANRLASSYEAAVGASTTTSWSLDAASKWAIISVPLRSSGSAQVI